MNTMDSIELPRKTIAEFTALLSTRGITHPLLQLNDQFKLDLLQTKNQLTQQKESPIQKMELPLAKTISLLLPELMLKKAK